MAVTNQAHILIGRASQNPSTHSASLSSPTETYVHAAAIATTPSWQRVGPPNGAGSSADVDSSDGEGDSSSEDAIEVEETFTRCNSKMPGTVKIIVENTTFWAHKEVLYFACPFFASALTGNWAETNGGTTNKRRSISSVITIPQPSGKFTGEEKSIAQTEYGVDPPIEVTEEEEDSGDRAKDYDSDHDTKEDYDDFAQIKSEGDETCEATKQSARNESLKALERPRGEEPFAVIVLREEKAHIFHDFLKFVYPHLECTVAWNNVEGLFNIAHKLCVDTLQQACLSFLITHAAGKPIKAMRIAELFSQDDLYREASRFVLENPGGWPEHELATLSPETLLKLEKRRNWFLERVLKLGLTNIAKVYQCHPLCPDSAACGKQLDDRWRAGYHAVFRFGPCQPSMVYRYLRTLEALSPPLQLGQVACQNAAKAFCLNLFDRMFSLGVRGSEADIAQPANSKGTTAIIPTGPRRQFLYCTLRPDTNIPRVRSPNPPVNA